MPEYENHPFEDLAFFRNPPKNADTRGFLSAFRRCYQFDKQGDLSEITVARSKFNNRKVTEKLNQLYDDTDYQSIKRKIEKFKKAFRSEIAPEVSALSRYADKYYIQKGYLKQLDKNDPNQGLIIWDNGYKSFELDESQIPFSQHISRLEESLDIINAVLETKINLSKKPVGKPKGISLDMYLSRTVVLCHIFLGLQPKITNNETDPLFLIILRALQLARESDNEPNISRYLKPIFHDPDIITRVKFIYEEYDRPDLYQQYLKKTKLKN